LGLKKIFKSTIKFNNIKRPRYTPEEFAKYMPAESKKVLSFIDTSGDTEYEKYM